jgi:hypothetical protein
VFLPVADDVVGPLEAALGGDPGRWLPEAVALEPGTWQAEVRLGPLHRWVACEVGPVRIQLGSRWRNLAWTPIAHAHDPVPVHEGLPHFTGEIGLSVQRRVFVLDGSYDVPAGRVGEFVDAVALGALARRTGSALLSDIVQRVADNNGDPAADLAS